jgi:threonine synthase
MDILVSSNFERAMWYFARGDSRTTNTSSTPQDDILASSSLKTWMASLRSEGGFTVPPTTLSKAQSVFKSFRVSDEETLDAIRRYYGRAGMRPERSTKELGKNVSYLLDPHTAVGVVAAERLLENSPPSPALHTIILSTASPGKFPDAIERALNGCEDGVSVPAYESYAPRKLVEQKGLPKRVVEVEMGGERMRGIEGVKRVLEGTLFASGSTSSMNKL